MNKQKDLHLQEYTARQTDAVRTDALNLYSMWKLGMLGGEKMPEDVHPNLPTDSPELLHYLTLGMCLNYQRNSYSLWESCTKGYYSSNDKWIFDPNLVATKGDEILREVLVRHKIALQPNKHVNNWRRVSEGIVSFGKGNMANILEENNFDIAVIREFIQTNKKSFPYLAGNKICNYWLYVLWQYTSFPLINREALTIAPDTHVINASIKLGIIDPSTASGPKAQEKCIDVWNVVLEGTGLAPIDIHTPLWLWSRLKFPKIITNK